MYFRIAYSRMKNILIAVAFVAFLGCAFAEDVPLWYQERTLQFSEREFVSAVGTGYSETSARNNALSTLALYFDSRIQATRTTGFYASEQMGDVEKRRTAASETTVTTDSHLPAVQCTTAFYNAARAEYAVCAYIKKADAIAEYNATLVAGITEAESGVRTAEAALPANALAAYASARKALGRLDEFSLTTQYLSVLDADAGMKNAKSISALRLRGNDVVACAKPQLTFAVHIENDDAASVATVIQTLLETQGFSCTSAMPAYAVTGALRFAESQNAVGVFVRPSLSLTVSSQDGVVGSYSRQYPKYGHLNLEGAYAKARVEIEKDLKANLLDALF